MLLILFLILFKIDYLTIKKFIYDAYICMHQQKGLKMAMSNCEWAELMEDCGGYEGPDEHLEQCSIDKFEDEQEVVTNIEEHEIYLKEHNYFKEKNEYAMRVILGNDELPALGKIVLSMKWILKN